MKGILIIAAILAILALVVPVAGCTGTTKIGDILADPTQYEGKEINIKGTVGNTLWFAALNKGAYQLGDGSGTIWIITAQPPPQKGAQITSEGTVSTAVIIEGRALGTVISETKRG